MAQSSASRSPLQRYLGVQAQTDRAILKMLRAAAQDLEHQINVIANLDSPSVSQRVRLLQLRAAEKQIKKRLVSLVEAAGGEIRGFKIRAAAEAGEVVADTTKIFKTAGLSDAEVAVLHSAIVVQAQKSVDAAVARMQGASYRPLSDRVYKTRQLINGQVSKIIQSHLARGSSARALAKDVRSFIDPNVRGGVRYASMRLARTEINNAFHAVTVREAQESPFVEAMRWNLSGSHPRPDDCNDYADQGTFLPEEVPEKPHPNCFPEGTLVEAQGVRAITKRWHIDGLVDVFFGESAPQLSGTPNHPTYTTRGWVPLSALCEGDYVARGFSGDRMAGPVPDEEKIVSRVEEIPTAIGMTDSMITTSVPSSSEQFHGDGAAIGEVDVVLTASFFQDAFMIAEEMAEIRSSGVHAPISSALFASDGALAELFVRSLAPTYSCVSGRDDRLALLDAQGLPRISATPHLELEALEHLSDLSAREADDLARLDERLSGRVHFDRVTGVGFRPWSGHVYNLETESGWYTANSIVVHNCLCYVTPTTPSREQFLINFQSGKYDRFLDETLGDQAA